MSSPATRAPASSNGLGQALKLLSDPTRLRILSLLEREELAVGELSRSLGISQSRVSNHLRLLRDAEVLHERHAGTSTYLRLAAPGAEDAGPDGVWRRLWVTLREELAQLPEHAADRVRLERVVAERRARDGDFFDRLAGSWDTVAGTFSTGQARLRLATQLLDRDLVVADLGCGTGSMGVPLLGLVGRLICVDHSRGMLREAEKRLAPIAQGTALEYRQGSFDALPLTDGEVSAAVCGMVMHHLCDLDRSLTECTRVLAGGGTLTILELAPHRETWMHAAQGDRHLGLDAQDLLAALARAGLNDLALIPIDDRYRPRRPDQDAGAPPVELNLYAVRGRKPTAG